MSMVVSNEEKRGPFAEFASETVLTKLKDFEASVEKSYSLSILDGAVSDASPSRAIPCVAWDQVAIDDVLGEGGFSFIFRVKLDQESPDAQQKEFALKCLKAKAIKSEDDLIFNAMDLYTESYLLTRLNHPNIIGIHGIVNSQLPDSYKSADGYFILLDIMQTTLMDELARWRENKSRQSRSKAGIVQRLQHAMMPVVEAMQYLHRHDIVLRDLKPENIGFDETGRAKLFDFGLARHISAVEDDDIAGSICYMAPEIMLEEGTFFASDVYSFAIVLWELCTLQIPLIDFENMEEVRRRVAEGNWRPNTSRIPSKTLRNLIKRCWHRDPKARPDFVEIEKELYKACNKHEHGLLHDSKNNLIGVEMKGVVTSSSSGSLFKLLSANSGHSIYPALARKF